MAFAAQGLACLGCLVGGFVAIRSGEVARHRRLMLSAAALAFGAVVLRGLLIGIDRLGVPFEVGYAVAAWMAWIVPLAAIQGWLSWAARRAQDECAPRRGITPSY